MSQLLLQLVVASTPQNCVVKHSFFHILQLDDNKYLKLNTLLNYKHFYYGENYLFVVGQAFNLHSVQINGYAFVIVSVLKQMTNLMKTETNLHDSS